MTESPASHPGSETAALEISNMCPNSALDDQAGAEAFSFVVVEIHIRGKTEENPLFTEM